MKIIAFFKDISEMKEKQMFKALPDDPSNPFKAYLRSTLRE